MSPRDGDIEHTEIMSAIVNIGILLVFLFLYVTVSNFFEEKPIIRGTIGHSSMVLVVCFI